MKTLYRILLLLSVLLVSCGKIELEDVKDNSSSKNESTGGDTTTADSCVYTVSTFASAPDSVEVTLKAYIVGYMPGSSVKGAVFSAEGAVQTNLVLADSPDEEDAENCATAQLLKDTDVREALNLQDNPGMLHVLVKLTGTKMKYCYAAGLKPVYYYELVSESEDDGGDDDDSGGSSDEAHQAFPEWSQEGAEVFEGC